MDIAQLALALGASLTAGLNLYLTLLTLGLLHRYDWLTLPANLEILSHPAVMGTAAVLLVVEFVADKVPYIDNTWDFIHTFVRVPAGAVLAASVLTDISPELIWVAALVGGFVSFAAHGAKSTARMVVNTSPEPFSNWVLSAAEDALSLALLWLVSVYPTVALLLSVGLLGLCLAVIYLFYRFFRRIFRPNPATQPSS